MAYFVYLVARPSTAATQRGQGAGAAHRLPDRLAAVLWQGEPSSPRTPHHTAAFVRASVNLCVARAFSEVVDQNDDLRSSDRAPGHPSLRPTRHGLPALLPEIAQPDFRRRARISSTQEIAWHPAGRGHSVSFTISRASRLARSTAAPAARPRPVGPFARGSGRWPGHGLGIPRAHPHRRSDPLGELDVALPEAARLVRRRHPRQVGRPRPSGAVGSPPNRGAPSPDRRPTRTSISAMDGRSSRSTWTAPASGPTRPQRDERRRQRQEAVDRRPRRPAATPRPRLDRAARVGVGTAVRLGSAIRRPPAV